MSNVHFEDYYDLGLTAVSDYTRALLAVMYSPNDVRRIVAEVGSILDNSSIQEGEKEAEIDALISSVLEGPDTVYGKSEMRSIRQHMQGIRGAPNPKNDPPFTPSKLPPDTIWRKQEFERTGRINPVSEEAEPSRSSGYFVPELDFDQYERLGSANSAKFRLNRLARVLTPEEVRLATAYVGTVLSDRSLKPMERDEYIEQIIDALLTGINEPYGEDALDTVRRRMMDIPGAPRRGVPDRRPPSDNADFDDEDHEEDEEDDSPYVQLGISQPEVGRKPAAPRPPREEDPALANDPLISQYRERVGGPIWRGILQREREYWDNVINKRTSKRPDWNNPIGGLIDVTDNVQAIYYQFDRPDPSNWTVGAGYTEGIVTPQPSDDQDYDTIYNELAVEGASVAVAGGYPLQLLIGTKANDVDVFLIDPKSDGTYNEEWSGRIKKYINEMIDTYGASTTYVTEHSISIDYLVISSSIPTKIQVILRVYRSLTEALMGFDIGACGVGLYQGRLYATERALYEIVNRTIMISMNRASTSYPYRLIKYAYKGFGLHVEGVEQLLHQDDNYYFEKTPSILESIDLSVRRGPYFTKRLSRPGGGYNYVRPKRPIQMTSDYGQRNNSGANDRVDYNGIYRTRFYKDPEDLPDNIPVIYQNPFRQGSLSFYPIDMPLKQWVGRHAILEGGISSGDGMESDNEDVTGVDTGDSTINEDDLTGINTGDSATNQEDLSEGEQLLRRILNITGRKLADRLEGHPEWDQLDDEELIRQFHNSVRSSANITDLIGLSLIRYYYGR